MQCVNHPQNEAVGTCVSCGKFICDECNTEVDGKNHCKKCIGELLSAKSKQIEKLEDKPQAPTVFMNAGGASSSSSSSSSIVAGGYGRPVPPYPRNSILAHILLLIFTAGIGNIIYFIYVLSKQNQWRHMYGR